MIPDESTASTSDASLSSPSASPESSSPDPELVTVSSTTARQCICNRMLRPVCGANRKTYPNPCLADCEGVTIVKNCGCGAACDLLSDYDVIMDDSSTTEAPSIAPPLTTDSPSVAPFVTEEEVTEDQTKDEDLDEEIISTTEIPSIEDITELELDLVRQLEAFEEEPEENEAQDTENEVNVSDEETSSQSEDDSEDEAEDDEEIEDNRPEIFINENGDLGIATKGLLFYLFCCLFYF